MGTPFGMTNKWMRIHKIIYSTISMNITHIKILLKVLKSTHTHTHTIQQSHFTSAHIHIYCNHPKIIVTNPLYFIIITRQVIDIIPTTFCLLTIHYSYAPATHILYRQLCFVVLWLRQVNTGYYESNKNTAFMTFYIINKLNQFSLNE